jgi:hypothetical protein
MGIEWTKLLPALRTDGIENTSGNNSLFVPSRGYRWDRVANINVLVLFKVITWQRPFLHIHYIATSLHTAEPRAAESDHYVVPCQRQADRMEQNR